MGRLLGEAAAALDGSCEAPARQRGHGRKAGGATSFANKVVQTTVEKRMIERSSAKDKAKQKKDPKYVILPSDKKRLAEEAKKEEGQTAGAGGSGTGGEAGSGGGIAALRPKPCFVTDYSASCPQGWTETEPSGTIGGNEDEPTGVRCVAPSAWKLAAGCSSVISANLTKKEKLREENMCMVRWPCKGGATRLRNYTLPCPKNWVYYTDGTCRAGRRYKGPCMKTQQFLGFTMRMKQQWEELCDVSWPDYQTAMQSRMERIKSRFSWKKGDQDLKKEIEKRMQLAVWSGHCSRNYDHPCPKGFDLRLPGGLCVAREGWAAAGPAEKVTFVPGEQEGMRKSFFGLRKKPVKQCPSVVDMSRFSPQMKAAFAAHCRYEWPCIGEVVTAAAPAPLLLGLAFL